MRTSACKVVLWISMACLIMAGAACFAWRPVRLWQPEELLKEADVVVIATAQSTQDAGHVETTRIKPDTWVAVDTQFAVQAALKGKISGKTVTLRHFRYHSAQANITVVDGPVFVAFPPRPDMSYLLFLKRDTEGHFTPVTGQYDPGQSFSRLMPVSH